ncbi:amidohydrolase [candidate division TA06 bacterium]|uniref:Amidohydrolase n=1 Tax=candidate division TA06 bacterium TaxID=2250710 RepID=A0A933MJ77_UNCT6|nr:amidohydrolase [candidate division TA06 bacterium]
MKASDIRFKDYVIAWRRRFHARPELSFNEVLTSKAIAAELKRLGYQVKTGVGKTGVVGLIKGKSAGRTVALRADMDALPVQEENQVPYRSRNPGKMHACGHDGHCAMLLGAALILARDRANLKGHVKLLFQPGEETPPGGALGMIAAGALQNPKVNAVFGLHLDSSLPSGRIGLRQGPMMAASDNFDIIIKGKGGHAARPHHCLDPIAAGAQIVMALQTIVSRRTDPVQPAVVTVGKFVSGAKHNIIPETALLEGTARSIDRHTWKMMPLWIKQTAEGTAKANGLAAAVEYERGYPVLYNDPKMVDFAESVINRMPGHPSVVHIKDPLMGGEDFAYFLQKAPGAFLRLGSCKDSKTAHPWHHPKFNIDEEVLPTGAKLLAELAEQYLGLSA